MRFKKVEAIFAAVMITALGVGVNNVVGRSDPEGAKKAAENMGFDKVEITGKVPFWSAPKDSYYRTKFNAVNSKGTKVTVMVTQGFKFTGSPATVRLDN